MPEADFCKRMERLWKGCVERLIGSFPVSEAEIDKKLTVGPQWEICFTISFYSFTFF